MKSGRLSAALGLVLGAAAFASAAPAYADGAPAGVGSVTIAGDPVVGGTLTAVVEPSGDPEPAVAYAWARCHPVRSSSCHAVDGASSATYVPVEADRGSPLIVRVTAANALGSDEAKSAPTAPVQAATAPTPEPTATPEPSATPAPDPLPLPAVAPALATAPSAEGAAYALPPAPRYLEPFPVVRIRGSVAARGAIVTLLRVRAPRGAAVTVRCAGRRCPVRRLARRPGRIRAFERFLRAGIRITIRVRRRGYVGKYVRLTVRAGKRPARRDACVVPGSSRPVACPPA